MIARSVAHLTVTTNPDNKMNTKNNNETPDTIRPMTVGEWVHKVIPSSHWGPSGWLHTIKGSGTHLVTVWGGTQHVAEDGRHRGQGWRFSADEDMGLYSLEYLCGGDCEGSQSHTIVMDELEIHESLEQMREDLAESLKEMSDV